MKNNLPSWFKQEIPQESVKEKLCLLHNLGVHTVCVEAHCPNFTSCFNNSQLTFLILGDTCTRNCRFCAVKKSQSVNLPLDLEEPLRVAQAVRKIGLRYVILTSVTRDDLKDGGADIFVKTIQAVREIDGRIGIEVLIPDFAGNKEALSKLAAVFPAVIAHNIETVERLYSRIRPQAKYRISLNVLKEIKRRNPQLVTKSSLLLGMGEENGEVEQAMKDLRDVHCDILVLGQYLAPSPTHYPVKEYISIAQFQEYSKMAMQLGFKSVLAHPLARTSYKAEEVFLSAAGI